MHIDVVLSIFGGVIFAGYVAIGVLTLRRPREVTCEDLPQVRREGSEAGRKFLAEAWSKAIDVQTHFNGMLQQIRVSGLSVAILVAGAGLAAIGQEATLEIVPKHPIHAAALIELCAMTLIIGLMAFESYFFALLLAAVRYAEAVEAVLPHGLTTSICADVPGNWAHHKMMLFWLSALVAIGVLFVALMACGGYLTAASSGAEGFKWACG